MRIRHERGQKQLQGHAVTQDERTPASETLRPKRPTSERQRRTQGGARTTESAVLRSAHSRQVLQK